MGKLVAILVAAVALSACGLTQLLPGGNQPLPTASATLHSTRLDLPRGSYCWSRASQGACADSAPIDTLITSGYLKPYRTAGGFSVQLAFSSPPTNYAIELVRSPGGAQSMLIQSQPTLGIPASPPAQAGVYVYRVSGKWPQGTVDFFLPLDLIPGIA